MRKKKRGDARERLLRYCQILIPILHSFGRPIRHAGYELLRIKFGITLEIKEASRLLVLSNVGYEGTKDAAW